ncbi:MAG: pyrroline-5-carboxylate reductase [Streptococcaceae bacterium]|jgi:pyrroline-5-carboxylate reductase|nr:pyrroline-5-carboxylate reductase [Streptococcaceae bacterium]
MKLGFIGHGNMAKAMIAGITASGLVKSDDIQTSHTDAGNQAIIDFADIIFLAIKPQIINQALSNLTIPKDKLLVTMSPGVATSNFPENKVIRTMPNTPALVGEGVTAVCKNDKVTDAEYTQVKELLASFSTVYDFPESQMDATIALSGSSPAYVYYLIEAMADASSKDGISRDIAIKMAAQTLLGTAKMVLASNDSPASLRERVCSKGGTTIEAVNVLTEKHFPDLIAEAMNACTARAKEMTQEFEA